MKVTNGWNKLLWIAGLVGCLSAATESRAVIYTNQYDFQGTNAIYVTQAGWTPLTWQNTGTVSSAGWVFPATHFFFVGSEPVLKATSTQSPTDVTSDTMIFNKQGVGSITAQFRDIVPVGTTNVTTTIWRVRADDGTTWNFSTYLSYNGGPTNLMDSGDAGAGNIVYHLPLTLSANLTPAASLGTLDFFFIQNDTDSSNKLYLDGIQDIFAVPEPSSLVLLAVGGFVVMRARKARRA